MFEWKDEAVECAYVGRIAFNTKMAKMTENANQGGNWYTFRIRAIHQM